MGCVDDFINLTAGVILKEIFLGLRGKKENRFSWGSALRNSRIVSCMK